jgi:hypothetical protein
VRLAVNSDIARAMRDGEPTGRIVQRVVAHSPHFRSAYSTISADGLVAVDCSAGTSEERWSDATPPVLSSDTLGTLAEVDLIATGATGDGTTGADLPAALATGDIPAVLQAPVRHATMLAGGSMPPHAWSSQERIMLREVADFLGVALRNAEATPRLEDSERRFRQLAESSQAVIVLHQKEGAVYLNPEFVRLSGYAADELQQTSLWDVIHGRSSSCCGGTAQPPLFWSVVSVSNLMAVRRS